MELQKDYDQVYNRLYELKIMLIESEIDKKIDLINNREGELQVYWNTMPSIDEYLLLKKLWEFFGETWISQHFDNKEIYVDILFK